MMHGQKNIKLWVTFFWQEAVFLRDLCTCSLIITEGPPNFRVTGAPDLLPSLLSSTLFSHTLGLCSSPIVRHTIDFRQNLVCFTLCFVCQTGIRTILYSAAANMTRIQSVVLIYLVVDFSGYIPDATYLLVYLRFVGARYLQVIHIWALKLSES